MEITQLTRVPGVTIVVSSGLLDFRIALADLASAIMLPFILLRTVVGAVRLSAELDITEPLALLVFIADKWTCSGSPVPF